MIAGHDDLGRRQIVEKLARVREFAPARPLREIAADGHDIGFGGLDRGDQGGQDGAIQATEMQIGKMSDPAQRAPLLAR